MPDTTVLASNNAHKMREIEAVVGSRLSLVAQREYDVPEAEETGLTFVENAILKARNACSHTGLPALADDSGLEVDCLDGEPGIYSARYSGPGATDARNNARLLDAIREHPLPRTARFHCVIVLMTHATDPDPLIAHGRLEGGIIDTARGDNGFGYDPIFLLPDRGQTLAEVGDAEKNRISHRALALEALAARLGL